MPTFAGSLVALFLAYGLYKVIGLIYGELTSPLRDLPGPKSSSWIYGNFREVEEAETSVLHEKWVQQYGPTLRFTGFLGLTRLYTMDTKALNHVLMNSYDYQKPEPIRYHLVKIFGNGLLVTEGDKHKQQRKVMNPAFGQAQIRESTETFVDKSLQLRDIWAAESLKQGGTGRIDVLLWLSRMTLDVIGKAGFNYIFESLNNDPKPNELNQAFSVLFRAGTKPTIIPMLRAWLPFFRFLPAEHAAEIKQARDTISHIGRELLRESKAIGKTNSSQARDLLSLLVRANTAKDLPKSQRLSDKDVLAQVPTFLVAGHETTSTGTTWALYALTQSPKVQRKLREELLTVDTDNPTMDQLNSLPYLDVVVRETLRVHAPVPSAMRVAMKDDVLPLSKPFIDRKGNVNEGIRVKKGQVLEIPILALNRDKSIWGQDALEFRPERWDSIPEATSSIPGIWGNMLTFLGGPRACIGYRFSLVEMKALLFTLVRAFEFELAVPPDEIGKKSAIVQRPIVRSDPKGGNQMPLLVRPVAHADP